MANTVSDLTTKLAAIIATVSTIAQNVSLELQTLAEVKDDLATENTGIAGLVTAVAAVADLVVQLRTNPDLPQSLFDQVDALQTALSGAATAAAGAGTAVAEAKDSVEAATTSIGAQAQALANIVTPPAPPTP